MKDKISVEDMRTLDGKAHSDRMDWSYCTDCSFIRDNRLACALFVRSLLLPIKGMVGRELGTIRLYYNRNWFSAHKIEKDHLINQTPKKKKKRGREVKNDQSD